MNPWFFSLKGPRVQGEGGKGGGLQGARRRRRVVTLGGARPLVLFTWGVGLSWRAKQKKNTKKKRKE